jgi:hypothetical protein
MVESRLLQTRPQVPWLVKVLVLIAGVSYLWFTMTLLSSGGSDKTAGWYFLCNVPFVLTWVFLVVRSHRRNGIAGIACAVGQVFVTAAMIAKGIGEIDFVIEVNACIAAVPLVLAFFGWRGTRESKALW